MFELPYEVREGRDESGWEEDELDLGGVGGPNSTGGGGSIAIPSSWAEVLRRPLLYAWMSCSGSDLRLTYIISSMMLGLSPLMAMITCSGREPSWSGLELVGAAVLTFVWDLSKA